MSPCPPMDDAHVSIALRTNKGNSSDDYRFVMADLMVLCMSHLGSIEQMLHSLCIDIWRQFFLQLLLFGFVFLDNVFLLHLDLIDDRFGLSSCRRRRSGGRRGFWFGSTRVGIQLVSFLLFGLHFPALVAATLVFFTGLVS